MEPRSDSDFIYRRIRNIEGQESEVRLTGHWIARSWSDEEILTVAEGLTLPGYTVAQTRLEVAQMITGGRVKWIVPNPQHTLDDLRAAVPLAPAFVEDLNIAMLPRRRWLLGRSLLRGNLTVKVAPPGVGKSTLCLERAIAVVTGRPITGEEVHEQVKVWVYNNEDDGDELKRRLAAMLQHWNIPLDEIKGRSYGGFEGNAQTLRILVRLEKKEAAKWPAPSVIRTDPRVCLNLTHRSIPSILKYDKMIARRRPKNSDVGKGYY